MARRSYSPRPWREVANSDEPCVIGPDEIAAFLERSGRPRMAEYVRDIGNMQKRQAWMEQRLRDDYAAVLERLQKYEPPPPPYTPPSCVPPPEASD